MHRLLDGRLNKEMLMLGNEVLSRGVLDAGFAFAASYPGTPSSEIALQLFHILRESDLYFEYNANEKVSIEVASCAAMCGLRSIISLKHRDSLND